jgi:hypothetical protein
MTVSFDKCIQRTFSTALNVPLVSQPQASLSSSETVAGASPVQLLRPDYVHSPPFPMSGTKPSVTQDIIPSSANPEVERSPRLDIKKFIEVAEPGAYQVTHSYSFYTSTHLLRRSFLRYRPRISLRSNLNLTKTNDSCWYIVSADVRLLTRCYKVMLTSLTHSR